MPEAVATLPPSGAGRLLDVVWPGRLTALGGGSYDAICSARNGGASFGGATSGGNRLAAVHAGVPCVRFEPTAVAIFNDCMTMMVRTTRSPVLDGREVYRLIWIFRGSGDAPNAGVSHGCELLRSSNNNNVRILGGNTGFGFRLKDATTLEWLVRGPNGLVSLDVTAAPFDVTAWHTLDLRIFSATADDEAGLEVRLDDAIVDLGPLNTSWAVGTNLPGAALTGTFTGFLPTLAAASGVATRFDVYQLRYIAAPTAIDTY